MFNLATAGTMNARQQLCLTAAVAAASHGIGVLYLDTANGCSVRRMQQIARARYADANGVSDRVMRGSSVRLDVCVLPLGPPWCRLISAGARYSAGKIS